MSADGPAVRLKRGAERMGRLFLLGTSGLLLSSLAGCFLLPASAGVPKDVVRIGVLAPTSGTDAGASIFNGAELAAETAARALASNRLSAREPAPHDAAPPPAFGAPWALERALGGGGGRAGRGGGGRTRRSGRCGRVPSRRQPPSSCTVASIFSGRCRRSRSPSGRWPAWLSHQP